jgi:SNF2 family DNA or RNA helicase
MSPSLQYLDVEDMSPSDCEQIEDINTLEDTIERLAVLADANSKSINQWTNGGISHCEIEGFHKAIERDNLELEKKQIHVPTLERKGTREAQDADKETKLLLRAAARRKRTGHSVVTDAFQMINQKEREHAKAKKNAKKRRHSSSLVQDKGTESLTTDANKKRRIMPQLLSSQTDSATAQPLKLTFDTLNAPTDVAFEESDLKLSVKIDVDEETASSFEVSIIKPVADVLKSHQEEGIRFMWKNSCADLSRSSECTTNEEDRNKDGFGGCILAHNMGLGKSLQVSYILYSEGTFLFGKHRHEMKLTTSCFLISFCSRRLLPCFIH